MTITTLDSYNTLTNYQVRAIEHVLKLIDSEFLEYFSNLNIILLDFESLDIYYRKLISPEVDINKTFLKFGFVADDIISIAGGNAIYISPNKFKYYHVKAIGRVQGSTNAILTCRLLGILLMNIILMYNPDISENEALELTLNEFEKFSKIALSRTEFKEFYGLTLSNIRYEFLEFINKEFKDLFDEELI